MRRTIVVGALLAGVALGAATPAAAQVTVGWDVGAFSDYVWRGITYTNNFVLEPDAYLTIPIGRASLTGGGWANIEPGKYDGSSAISEGGGTSSFNLTEFDWWGEIGIPAGIATLTGGATGYIFPNDAGFQKSSNTVEVYGKVALSTPLSPKLSVYYDVDKVKGAYLEGSVAHSIPLGPAFSLNLGALAGYSAGQEVSASDPSANFADKGLTHVDLSASTSFSAGPLSIAPAFHLVFNIDDNTKWTETTPTGFNSKDAKIWFGGTISWSKGFGGSTEE